MLIKKEKFPRLLAYRGILAFLLLLQQILFMKMLFSTEEESVYVFEP